MGAKASVWRNRAAVVLAAAAGLLFLARVPVPASARVAVVLAAVAIGGAAAFRGIPAFDPLGRVRWRLSSPAPRKICALTFDDGPSAGTAEVLDLLRLQGVKATFFVLAANARRHPHILRRLADEGHTVAIHGTTHRKLHRASEPVIEHELATADRDLRRLGVTPARLYRTPHGLKCAAVFRVARRLGFELWAWSRGVWDTDRPAPDVLVRRATRFARPGMVLLLHDGRGDDETPDVSAMVRALPEVVSTLRARGFEFVTLDRTS